jgi:hypothetical protein
MKNKVHEILAWNTCKKRGRARNQKREIWSGHGTSLAPNKSDRSAERTLSKDSPPAGWPDIYVLFGLAQKGELEQLEYLFVNLQLRHWETR